MKNEEEKDDTKRIKRDNSVNIPLTTTLLSLDEAQKISAKFGIKLRQPKEKNKKFKK